MIEIETKTGMVDMSLNEFTRWACLLEAYDFINERADQLNINAIDMVKPLAIEKYIEERYLSMRHDITVEYSMGTF